MGGDDGEWYQVERSVECDCERHEHLEDGGAGQNTEFDIDPRH